MNANRIPSQKEALLSMAKRNLNAPVLNNDMSPKILGRWLFKNFVKSVIRDDAFDCFDKFFDDKVNVNEFLISEWLTKQPPAVRRLIASEVPLAERRANVSSFMIKPSVKPCMDVGAVS